MEYLLYTYLIIALMRFIFISYLTYNQYSKSTEQEKAKFLELGQFYITVGYLKSTLPYAILWPLDFAEVVYEFVNRKDSK